MRNRWQALAEIEFKLRQVCPISLIRLFFWTFSIRLLLTVMSSNVPINQSDLTAPTPQNTPLTQAPIAAGLSRPTVPDITEDNEAEDEQDASPAGGIGTAGIQAAMLGMVQGRLAGLVGKSSGYIEALPMGVKKNVEALKGVQVKQTELQNQYKRECLELEKKVSEFYS
jgi:nucleosome assembly protein 1-like 1